MKSINKSSKYQNYCIIIKLSAQILIEDEVHGVIEIHSYIEELVNHPQFQRLKKVKQVGLLRLSEKPDGDHTRFDHCIG